MLDGAVNKSEPSTGEPGEFVPKPVGFSLNRGVERALPQSLSSNERNGTARQNPPNVAHTDKSRGESCCQGIYGVELGLGRTGSQKTVVSNHLSTS
jgi:hypothetical protein